jgi:hypothetical protein
VLIIPAVVQVPFIILGHCKTNPMKKSHVSDLLSDYRAPAIFLSEDFCLKCLVVPWSDRTVSSLSPQDVPEPAPEERRQVKEVRAHFSLQQSLQKFGSTGFNGPEKNSFGPGRGVVEALPQDRSGDAVEAAVDETKRPQVVFTEKICDEKQSLVGQAHKAG